MLFFFNFFTNARRFTSKASNPVFQHHPAGGKICHDTSHHCVRCDVVNDTRDNANEIFNNLFYWIWRLDFTQRCCERIINANKPNYHQNYQNPTQSKVRGPVYLNTFSAKMLLKSDSAVTHQTLHGAPGCLRRRGERKYQRQQRSEFRSGVHRFLTHSGNWRHSCWQQNSASWWNETSGGVGHQVEQRDTVSNGGQSRSMRWEAEHGQTGQGQERNLARTGEWMALVSVRTKLSLSSLTLGVMSEINEL